MPKIACPAGRTVMRGGKAVAVWHKMDGSGSPDKPDGHCPACWKEPSKPMVEPGKPPEPQAGTPAKPAEQTKQPGIMRRLGFGSRETSPELPVQPPRNQPPEYFVDAKHTIEFANVIYGGVRWVCDLADKFLMTEEAGGKRFTREHPDLLVLSPFEKESITLDPQTDLWGRFATAATRMIGCKTQEQAHSAIDTLSFLGHFGMLIGFAFDHYWHAFKDGRPFRERVRKEKQARIEAHRLEVRNARNSARRESGDLAPAGQPGLAAPS